MLVICTFYGAYRWTNLTKGFHVACVCSVIHCRSEMISKCGKNKKVTYESIAKCATDILTTFWCLLWSVTKQMLSNMECFVLYIIYMYSNKETNWPLQIKLFCLKAGLVLFGEHEKSHLRNVLSMLQVKSNLRSICSNLGQFVST